jgi:hypothetical protein
LFGFRSEGVAHLFAVGGPGNFCYFADHGGNWSNIMHIAFSKGHNQGLASSDTWKLGVKNLKWRVLDVYLRRSGHSALPARRIAAAIWRMLAG